MCIVCFSVCLVWNSCVSVCVCVFCMDLVCFLVFLVFLGFLGVWGLGYPPTCESKAERSSWVRRRVRPVISYSCKHGGKYTVHTVHTVHTPVSMEGQMKGSSSSSSDALKLRV